MSMAAAHAVYSSRSSCADFFGAEPENTVFTLNCTHALNMAIKGLAHHGVHFVISDIEHNAVLRPVHSLTEYGVEYSVFETSPNPEITVQNAGRAIRRNTAALICTAAGNVTGARLPLKELAELCRSKKICFIVDAAQGAGILPLSLADGINIICTAGHKGLYGPMGTGLMITDGKYPLRTIFEGGTGSASESLEQPDFLPDRFESGTINTPGAVALGSGVDFVRSRGTERIFRHEMELCRSFCSAARRIPGVILYTDIDENPEKYVPVVPFNIDGIPSGEASAALSDMGFYMRGGLHCAASAHKKLGTLEIGAVRFAPSVFNTAEDVSRLIWTLKKHKWQ